MTLYALSTCSFCRQAEQFLLDHNLDFKRVFVDELPVDEKRALKDDFVKRYQKKLLFPTLIIDDTEFLRGFIEDKWQYKLLESKNEGSTSK
jgi:glutaredoxin-like protein NrdH